ATTPAQVAATTSRPGAASLPRVFSPVAAAEVLRGLGLAEMTECALRTRAYRQQVPFHLNSRRIVFTLADLREIAEGHPRRPRPPPRPGGPAGPAPAGAAPAAGPPRRAAGRAVRAGAPPEAPPPLSARRGEAVTGRAPAKGRPRPWAESGRQGKTRYV